MRIAFFALTAMALAGSASAQQQAPFCVVTGSGSNCTYTVLDACRRVAQATNGLCTPNPAALTAPQQPSSTVLDGMSYIQGQGEAGRIAGDRRLDARLATQARTSSGLVVSYRCDQPGGGTHYTTSPSVGCVVIAVTPTD